MKVKIKIPEGFKKLRAGTVCDGSELFPYIKQMKWENANSKGYKVCKETIIIRRIKPKAKVKAVYDYTYLSEPGFEPRLYRHMEGLCQFWENTWRPAHSWNSHDETAITESRARKLFPKAFKEGK